VNVEVDVAADLPKVVAVRDHLHQVVLNLLLNAIHATARPAHEGTLRVGRVQLRARPEPIDGEDGIAIEVADDGCGIRADDLERIFDPFFTTKGPDQGSGLGLMISHRIVLDHGGRIEVESLEGRGASFRVRLPLGPPTH
jgi:signal transduction histidine kinase